MDYICFMTQFNGYYYRYYSGLQRRSRFVMA